MTLPHPRTSRPRLHPQAGPAPFETALWRTSLTAWAGALLLGALVLYGRHRQHDHP